jgi:hypothetical protein
MKTPIFKIALFISLFQLFGCTYAHYRPTVMNMPNFREKNEVLLAVNANTTTQSIGVDVQGAYALTNHLFVQGNYMNISDVVSVAKESGGFDFYSSGSQEAKRSFTSGEYGVGYFTTFRTQGTFSIVGGYGVGKMENTVEKGTYSADFSRIFLQSSLGYREKDVEFIGSLKFFDLNYTNLNYFEVSSSANLPYDKFNSSVPILETGCTMRVGGEKIKFQMQATTATSLVSAPFFKYDWLTLSAGICVQLNTKKGLK